MALNGRSSRAWWRKRAWGPARSAEFPSGLSLMVRVPHLDPELGRRVRVEDRSKPSWYRPIARGTKARSPRRRKFWLAGLPLSGSRWAATSRPRQINLVRQHDFKLQYRTSPFLRGRPSSPVTRSATRGARRKAVGIERSPRCTMFIAGWGPCSLQQVHKK